jgi:beta-N-acetylhexosaminidase
MPAGAACVSQTYDAMTQTQRFGQLFMVGLQPDQAPSGLDSTIRTWQIGSVIYLGGWSGAATVRATSEHLQQAAGGPVDLFIAADQEGGAVQQLKGLGFTVLPAALEQGALSSTRLTSLGATMARELAAAGVNVNLAPVADTVPPTMVATNAPIGKYRRELGTDPAVVAAAVCQGGRDHGPCELAHDVAPTPSSHGRGRRRVRPRRDHVAPRAAAFTGDPALPYGGA